MIGTFATRLGLTAGLSALALLGASPVQAQNPVKIGVLGPNSGPYAIIGEEVHHGFELYFEEVGNKAGGRPVQIIFEDSQAKPDVGLTKTQKLVERDGVSFIGGIVSSSVAYAVRDYVVEKKMPTVVTVASADGLTQKLASPYIFRTNSSGSQASHPFGKWLYDQGYRRIVMIAPNYAMGYEQTGGFARTFTALGGKVVKTMYPPLGTSDYGSFLTSFDKSQTDAVAAVFAGSEALKFVKQYDEYGLKGTLPLVGTSLLTDDLLLQQQGDSAIGITTAMHYSAALETAENKAFVAAYKKKYNRSPTLYSEASYVGARVIREALEAQKGNTADTAALLKAMEKVSFAAPRGHFSFDDHNSPVNEIYVFRVTKENGQLINKPIAKYDNIGQFYTWKPEEFMKMPGYADIANDWAK
jgi:branched-chain amino acid transport system substrate-binding protein